MPFAIIYARISDSDQSNYSIDAQVAACRDWCEKAGYDVFATMIEPGRSAATDNRPVFQRAVNAVLSGQAQVLVVHKFDRFARNTLDSRFWKTKLRESGADVISVTEPIEDTPAGAMMEQILEVFAEYYVLNLSFEVKKGLLQKAKNGIWPGRKTPTGYHRNENGQVIVTELGHRLGEAFTEFATGKYTLKSWAEEAYKRGYRGANKGKRIFPSVWHRVFTNKFYIGIVSWREYEFPGIHPPITDEETFYQVQEILHERSKGKRKRKSHFFLLKGLLYSTVHDRPMTGNAIRKSNGKRFYYYRAVSKSKKSPEHNIKTSKLEEQVVRILEGIYLENPDPYGMPTEYILALRVSQSVKELFEILPSKEEKRELLRAIFPKYGLKVGENGLQKFNLKEEFGRLE